MGGQLLNFFLEPLMLVPGKENFSSTVILLTGSSNQAMKMGPTGMNLGRVRLRTEICVSL